MSSKNLTALLLASLLAGCAASPTPNYDARFGDAVRAAREAQRLNPQGVAHHVPGLEGKAAQEATGRYQDSFKKPPPVVNVINIGGQIGR
jgi:uncharacterized lipoprotein